MLEAWRSISHSGRIRRPPTAASRLGSSTAVSVPARNHRFARLLGADRPRDRGRGRRRQRPIAARSRHHLAGHGRHGMVRLARRGAHGAGSAAGRPRACHRRRACRWVGPWHLPWRRPRPHPTRSSWSIPPSTSTPLRSSAAGAQARRAHDSVDRRRHRPPGPRRVRLPERTPLAPLATFPPCAADTARRSVESRPARSRP
jgi:hypothetical protein